MQSQERVTEQSVAAINKSINNCFLQDTQRSLPSWCDIWADPKISKRKDESFIGMIASYVVKETTVNKQKGESLKRSWDKATCSGRAQTTIKDIFTFSLSDVRLHKRDLSRGYVHFAAYSRTWTIEGLHLSHAPYNCCSVGVQNNPDCSWWIGMLIRTMR